ncbi:hypothetical protein DMB44_04945 [Thermoplasma sp. Kam2015]|nr:hypothetical protein DMB44_04945 [Thermoplasma sp. Kam2015]
MRMGRVLRIHIVETPIARYDKHDDTIRPSLKFGYPNLKLRGISLILRTGKYDIDAHWYRSLNDYNP